ncbi:MAG: YidC/Oxa1 family membrane protein insertase [bacterium]
MSYLFHTFCYNPLYNGLIALLAVFPWMDAGVAVIIFTILVKLALFPISKKAVRTQLLMKEIQKDIEEIKKKSGGNKQEEAQKTMALYKEKGINPFSGIFLMLIQLPIIFALYFIFWKGGLPIVDSSLLYSFIPVPTAVNMHFLGFLDITKTSIVVAALAAISQFYQIRLAMPAMPAVKGKIGEGSFKDELARSMSVQMKYVLPVFVFIGAYNLPSVVGIYWITSNLFAIGQELYMRKIHKKPSDTKNNQPVVNK